MISVVIPVRNQAVLLDQTLRSLVAEKAGHEVIVVDGGSRDGSIATAQRRDWLNLIETSDGTRGSRCNLGSTKAEGDIILFLRPGTVLERGWAERVEAEAKKDGVGAGSFKLDVTANDLNGKVNKLFGGVKSAVQKVADGSAGLFIRKELFLEMSGFVDQDRGEDVELIGRLRDKELKISRVGLSAIAPRNAAIQNGGVATAIVIFYHATDQHPARETLLAHLDEETATKALRGLYQQAKREFEMRGDVMVGVADPKLIDDANDVFGESVCYLASPNGCVGALLNEAFQLGYERAYVVDPVYPNFDADGLDDVQRSLDTADVVLGPGEDGVAYVVGARAAQAEQIVDCECSLPPNAANLEGCFKAKGLSVTHAQTLSGCATYTGFLESFGRGLIQV